MQLLFKCGDVCANMFYLLVKEEKNAAVNSPDGNNMAHI